jgi:PrtD family type I secretion system ABC transporter
MRWLFAKRLRPFVVLAGTASLLLNLALLMPALYMMQVFDRVFTSSSVETLVMLTLLTTLALALSYFLDTVRARSLGWAGRALDKTLSPSALGMALRRATAPSARADTDALRDITQLRSFLSGSGILALFDAPWLPVYLLVITLMHPVLGLVATIGAGVLAALGALSEKLTRRPSESALRSGRIASRHAESLARNAETIVGMGMAESAISGWQMRQQELLAAQAELGSVSSSLSATARMTRQALQVFTLGIGAWLVINTQASPGIMIAATILLGRALQPVEHLITGWKTLVEARSAWQRLQERATDDSEFPLVELPAPSGRLDVERISFGAVIGRPALIKGVNFSLLPGESLGILGPSASGKTTLVRLLLGLWKPQFGAVRLDGADIARWNRNALGLHVGYLPQAVELFSGTVAENIARLGQVDSTSVVKAARLAQAHEMILRLPQGYDTQIGEGGAVLSGGQRQRVALARALYGNPKLIVLDEPNANLDSEGELALGAALANLKALAVTVVMVTHNAALVAQLDKLALLKDGVLEAFGPTSAVLARLRLGNRSPVRVAALPAGERAEARA